MRYHEASSAERHAAVPKFATRGAICPVMICNSDVSRGGGPEHAEDAAVDRGGEVAQGNDVAIGERQILGLESHDQHASPRGLSIRPRPPADEPFPISHHSLRATNNASQMRASPIRGFGSLRLWLRATSCGLFLRASTILQMVRDSQPELPSARRPPCLRRSSHRREGL
jgi:hypothetical protein